jgi:hypothetical protein
MKPLWQKQLYKAADLVFVVPAGHPAWPANMYEPLLISLVFPFLRHNPWQILGTPKMHAVARELRQMSADLGLDGRNILRQLCLLCWKLQTVLADVVWKLFCF